MSLFFQSPGFLEESDDGAVGVPDVEVYRQERALADLAEPLGFDSLWSVEHHFDGYTMVPDVTQFLAYMAGRTSHIRLGSMVIVLPWNHPARTAGSVSMLDNLSDGRLMLGIGRGLGRIEFEGLGSPMEQSRERFVAYAQTLLRGLETGVIEYDGEILRQPRRRIRPAPSRSFRGRVYAAAVSPESMRIMAELGVGILIIPQKPWEAVTAELAMYREVYREVNGQEAPPTIVGSHVFCDEDEGRAKELGVRYLTNYYATVLKHYELAGDHFGQTQGYEYYEKMAQTISRHGEGAAERFYADLHVYGTPDQCVEKFAAIKDMVGCDHVIGIFSYGGMPYDEVRRNLELFNSKVQPHLKAM